MKEFGTAAILCGGKSSRMGFDKCSIKVNKKYLIEVIAEKLEEVFDEIILLSNDKNKFQNLKYEVCEDIIPGLGPMGAIYSALKYAKSEHVFITACDMPVVNIRLIKHMMELIQLKNVDGVVCRKSNYIEPLYAFYSKSMIDTIERQIERKNFRLIEIINHSKIYCLEEDKVREYSNNLEVFTNLNYKDDLAKLNKIFLKDEIEYDWGKRDKGYKSK